MAFCAKCGNKINDDTRFCTVCGAMVEPNQEQNAMQGNVGVKLQALNETAETTGNFEAADIQQNKAMAVLAYLWILVLVPLFAAKESRFARYHANQGLVLFIAEVAYGVVYSVLSSILLAISWRLYFITSILALFGVVFLVIGIIGIVNAANGRAKELPVIGGIRILN